MGFALVWVGWGWLVGGYIGGFAGGVDVNGGGVGGEGGAWGDGMVACVS